MKNLKLKDILTFEKVDRELITKEEHNKLEEVLNVFKNERKYLHYYYLRTFLSIQSINPNGGFPVAKKLLFLLEGEKS